MKPIFLGQIVATPGALEALEINKEPPDKYLSRHMNHDWGVMCEEDKKLNDEAVDHEGRLMSAYDLPDQTRIWIITEWDRSATTILLPSEY